VSHRTHHENPARVNVFFCSLVILALFPQLQAQAAPGREHWVATWATAQELVRPEEPPATATAQPRPARFPVPIATIKNQTVRMIVRTSLGGRRFRVQLSNAFGYPAVEIGTAHIALRSESSAIVPSSDRTLTFSQKSSVMIPPGGVVISDPVDLEVPPLHDLAISLYIPGETGPPPKHMFGLHTTYISQPGNFTAAPKIEDATTTTSYFWLSAVHVLAPADAGAIVALGDSITDGDQSTPDANRMWPAVLAQRILSGKFPAKFAVVNAGIAGNRVLSDAGPIGLTSALSRFDRDVLSLPGVRWVIFLEGINDINRPSLRGGQVTADDLIAGHRQIIARAHMHGIKIAGATLTPANNASPARQEVREALNRWIRTSGEYDAVIDFDAAVRDPANPQRFREGWYADGVHPNDAGYKAMADSIDLSIFLGTPAPAKASSAGKR
jgi:lysophospholipase L1-like esterase